MSGASRMLEARGVRKSFILHLQGGASIPVFAGVDLDLDAGECVVLAGASGAGKSTLMRMLYGNYRAQGGSLRVRHGERWIDLACATAREVLEIRRHTIGYVTQFLRVIPRVPALRLVAEPLLAAGVPPEEAALRAREMLARVCLPESLWSLAPATFSGGERQRINLARGFVHPYPILFLDEPTASLDAANRQIVVGLIHQARARGAAILGIFHDADVRDAVATRVYDVEAARRKVAA